MKGTCEQIPFHFFLKFMMLCYAGELGMLQLTVKNLLCYNNVGSPTALIKGQRRLSKWIVIVYHIQNGIVSIILFLHQNIEEK